MTSTLKHNVFFQLLKRLNHRGRLHAVPASLKGKYVIRFTVTSTHTTNDDIIKDWNEIRSVASEILEECNLKIDKRVPLKGKKLKFENFSSKIYDVTLISLILRVQNIFLYNFRITKLVKLFFCMLISLSLSFADITS